MYSQLGIVRITDVGKHQDIAKWCVINQLQWGTVRCIHAICKSTFVAKSSEIRQSSDNHMQLAI